MNVLKDSEDDADVCRDELPVIFQCQSCKSVLSDSLAFLIGNDDLKTITVSRVNSSVGLSTKLITSTHGVDQGSTYSPVECNECQAVVGKVYKTTPRVLDDLRDYYTLEANKLLIYQIGSASTTVSPADDTAHSLPNIIDLKTLKETVLKLQVLMCTMHQRIANIEQSLEIEDIQPGGSPQDLLPQALGSNPKQKTHMNSNEGAGKVSTLTSTPVESNISSSENDDEGGLEENVSKKRNSKRQSVDSRNGIPFEGSEDKMRKRSTKRLRKSGKD